MELPLTYEKKNGWIEDASGVQVCQFWDKHEEYFDNADENAVKICDAVNSIEAPQAQNQELTQFIDYVASFNPDYCGEEQLRAIINKAKKIQEGEAE